MANINRYDDYDRTLPKVFIGEWAAHTGSTVSGNRNNQYAAAAEAAFLTGVEKNADHVIMTSYAPLLARQGHQQWQPDLIWFDNDTVYASPSYYVQKMFSENLGDYDVEAVSGSDDVKVSASVKDGELIIKLVNVKAEPTEIRFNGVPPLDTADITVLAAEADAENSIGEPFKVAPKKVKAHGNTLSAEGFAVIVIRYKNGN